MRVFGSVVMHRSTSVERAVGKHTGAALISVALALACGLLVWMPGCSSDDCCGPDVEPPVFRARTSPENLLYNLKMAYAHRDVAEVDSLLAPDFEFVFCPYDQAQPNIPDSWNRAEEIEAHEGMFDEDHVLSLSMQFESSNAEVDPVHSAPGDTAWVASVTQMRLELFGTPPSTPDEPPQTFKVQDGQAHFWFKRLERTDPKTGDPIWIIFRCQETTIITNPKGTLPAEDAAWGSIKAVFR